MAKIIDMPRLADAMHEGVLRRWRKSEGEAVTPGEVLAEVETDKALLEWEAPHAGTLLKHLVPPGALVPVGDPIAIIGHAHEDVTALMVAARSRLSSAAGADRGPPTALSPGDTVTPLVRRTIAQRMLASTTSVPHFYLTADAGVDAAIQFRERLAHASGARVSMNDLVLKAAALALRKVPQANASFGDGTIVHHARVDIAMAVAIEDGVVTPVLRDVDGKPVEQVGREAHELAARARDRKLRPEEMTGATFSVSNLGAYGIDRFAAIINPPEAAILAVGRVRKEPVVQQGALAIGHRMALTLSCDHRVLDGALGARLLQAIIGALERPALLGG
jgi:pyruvate dehydrogenase E2 component (dihydrolipoamide acetyltransferase)